VPGDEEERTVGSLDGRRVLVTGASSGIGAAVARAVTDAGGRVAVLTRSTHALTELAAEPDGLAVTADRAAESSVASTPW
jgi:NADP-dependent 3-hydroxy acid dehydrogenase YdfG